MDYPKYLYEHIYGSIVEKCTYVVDHRGADNYFDSPFVRRWERIENESQEESFRESGIKINKQIYFCVVSGETFSCPRKF